MPSTDRRVFLSALTSVRGIAAWYVVLYHFRNYIPSFGVAFLPRVWDPGFLAVDLFFELSGFVIALNYIQFLNQPGPRFRRILSFLWLRLGRIYPLHFAVLCLMAANPLALWVFSAHGFSGNRYDPVYLVLSLFLVQNWGLTKYLAWNVPAWSISTEWFVYLTFPSIAWVVQRSRLSGSGWAVVVLLLAGVLAIVWSYLGLDLGDDIAQAGLFRCTIEFLMGTAVYCAWDRLRLRRIALRGDIAIGAAAALALAYALLPLPDAAVMPLCFALVVYGLADARCVSARLMSSPWLEWVGVVSYSTYLLHYPVREWVKLLIIHDTGPQPLATFVYLFVTAVLSVVFYRMVEVPGRDWFRAMTLSSGAPTGGAVRR